MDIAALARMIRDVPLAGTRRLVALAGPPASGKSTLAHDLAGQDSGFRVVPMDGFHLDNAVLRERGLLHRKGAPETFDVQGFVHLVRRLTTEDEIIFPSFDRASDRAIAGTGVIGPDADTVIVEGNYLLLDRPAWRDLAPLWTFAITLSVPLPILETRLIRRWVDHGFSPDAARRKAEENDLPNARLVAEASLPGDVVLGTDSLDTAGA